MAAECSSTFARLGLDPPKAIAITAPFPKLLRKAIDKREGAREAYRAEVVRLTRKLWEGNAMPFEEKKKTGQAIHNIVTALVPEIVHPSIDFPKAVELAKEQRVLKDRKRTDREGRTSGCGRRQSRGGGQHVRRSRSCAHAPSGARGNGHRATNNPPPARSRSLRRQSQSSGSRTQPPRLPSDAASQSRNINHQQPSRSANTGRIFEVRFEGSSQMAAKMVFFLGQYAAVEPTSHGCAIYKKVSSSSHSAHDSFMYYWDDSDGEQHRGWWIGIAVGGAVVYAHNEARTNSPPQNGWKYPYDEEVCRGLSVRPTRAASPDVAMSSSANQRGRSRTPPSRRPTVGGTNGAGPQSPNTLVRSLQAFLGTSSLVETSAALESLHNAVSVVSAPGVAAPAPTKQERDRAHFRPLIEDIYRQHNPSKLTTMTELMERFVGREESLFRAVCSKYLTRPAIEGRATSAGSVEPVTGHETDRRTSPLTPKGNQHVADDEEEVPTEPGPESPAAPLDHARRDRSPSEDTLVRVAIQESTWPREEIDKCEDLANLRHQELMSALHNADSARAVANDVETILPGPLRLLVSRAVGKMSLPPGEGVGNAIKQIECIKETLALAKSAWVGHQAEAILPQCTGAASTRAEASPHLAAADGRMGSTTLPVLSTGAPTQVLSGTAPPVNCSSPAPVSTSVASGGLPPPPFVFQDGGAPVAEDSWAHLRVRRPPVDPFVIAVEQASPTWTPTAGSAAMEFQFATSAPTRQERLWDLYVKCAYADVFVREVYLNTPWAYKINAEGGHGDRVPAVKMDFGVSIQWWEFSDGHFRLDGKAWKVDKVRAQFRKAFKSYTRGEPTEHSAFTGRKFEPAGGSHHRSTIEEVARRERAQRIAGRVLACAGSVFDPDGKTGLWDVLDVRIGARSLPQESNSPWSTLLRNGVIVSAWKDGRVKATSTHAAVQDIERVEKILCEVFHASWVCARTHATAAAGADAQLRFGTMGGQAAARGQAVFR